MVRKREVLKLIAARTREGRVTSFRTLVSVLEISPENACDHLMRLWRERLIEASTFRPSGYQFRLEPRESIRTVRFEIARRGKVRLRWYSKQKQKAWPW